MENVVIVSGCRTPIGKFGGSLKSLLAPDLGAIVMREAINRAGIDDNVIDDIKFGCCLERCDQMNTARVAALKAGIPQEIPAMTINRVCNSAMEAIASGYYQIRADEADIMLAGGVESMSNLPYVSFDARWGARLQDKVFSDTVMVGLHAGTDLIMGLTAEKLAEKHSITREEQDEIALRSNKLASEAAKTERFKDETFSITVKDRRKDVIVEYDEHPRPDTTMEQLAKLPPVFSEDGTVTAGNSSGINDGAAAMIIMSESKTRELGVEPLATIKGFAVAGVDPHYMGEGPVPATRKLFTKLKMTMSDVELVECNEAFAATYLACEKQLKWDRDIANVNGSGIGLGHPVGCTGTRIVVTLLHEMNKRDLNTGLATLCGGGGLGMSMIIERT
ncbi:MAG: thiolase family protein [Candidatus Hodarchaeales archaeon]|jgi:acetyl-CoA C-acetyltransferase